MIVDGIVELLPGAAAEGKKLEPVIHPLTAVTASQVPRATARSHYPPSSRPVGPSSAAALPGGTMERHLLAPERRDRHEITDGGFR